MKLTTLPHKSISFRMHIDKKTFFTDTRRVRQTHCPGTCTDIFLQPGTVTWRQFCQFFGLTHRDARKTRWFIYIYIIMFLIEKPLVGMPYFKIPKCWGQELQKSIGWLMMFDDVSFSNSQQSRYSYGDVSKPILLYFCGMNIIEHPFTRYFWGSLGYQGFDWFSTVAFEAVFSTRWYSGLPSNTPAESCAAWVAIGVCTRWWKGSRSCCKYGNSNFTRVYGKHIYILHNYIYI